MKFLKIFLAALLAVVVGSFLTTLLWVMSLVGMAGSMETPVVVESNSILRIDFTESITDSPSTDPLAGFDYATLQVTPTISLFKALQAIDAAKSDDRIKGIYIRPLGMGLSSTAALEELRAAILSFKESGKFVVAYGESFGQADYYLATAADKIYLQKEGNLSLQGFSYTIPFFKGLFDKLGIEYEIFRPTACKYKSAVEPYFLKKMSPENREQTRQMVNSMWGVLSQAIVESRSLESLEAFNRLVDRLELTMPEDALKHKLVDGLIYEDEMEQWFTEQGVERNADKEFCFVTLSEYATQVAPDVDTLLAPQVAIVYADGAIVDGEGTQPGNIFGNSLAAEIAKVRKNDDVKAVVLRVNSPGGSPSRNRW